MSAYPFQLIKYSLPWLFSSQKSGKLSAVLFFFGWKISNHPFKHSLCRFFKYSHASRQKKLNAACRSLNSSHSMYFRFFRFMVFCLSKVPASNVSPFLISSRCRLPSLFVAPYPNVSPCRSHSTANKEALQEVGAASTEQSGFELRILKAVLFEDPQFSFVSTATASCNASALCFDSTQRAGRLGMVLQAWCCVERQFKGSRVASRSIGQLHPSNCFNGLLCLFKWVVDGFINGLFVSSAGSVRCGRGTNTERGAAALNL